MKIRSLSMVIALAAVASGAMAGEVIHTASSREAVNRAHQALGVGDTAMLADVMPARGLRTAVDMPACSTCH